MNEKLRKILDLEAKEISIAFEKASIEGKGTPQEVAYRREAAFSSFVEKYFPFPYRVVKGNIDDSCGWSRLCYRNKTRFIE